MDACQTSFCPFHSFEIYKTINVETEILRLMLNADIIGFHKLD